LRTLRTAARQPAPGGRLRSLHRWIRLKWRRLTAARHFGCSRIGSAKIRAPVLAHCNGKNAVSPGRTRIRDRARNGLLRPPCPPGPRPARQRLEPAHESDVRQERGIGGVEFDSVLTGNWELGTDN